MKRTIIDDIREAWDWVAQWRERLQEFQGKRPNGPWELLEFVYQLKLYENKSYKEIAEIINQFLIHNLRTHYETVKQHERMGFKSDREDPSGNLYDARYTLLRLGIDRDDIEAYIKDGLQKLENNLDPFLPDTPFSTDMIRDRIRKFKQWAESIGYECPREPRASLAVSYLIFNDKDYFGDGNDR